MNINDMNIRTATEMTGGFVIVKFEYRTDVRKTNVIWNRLWSVSVARLCCLCFVILAQFIFVPHFWNTLKINGVDCKLMYVEQAKLFHDILPDFSKLMKN